MKKIDTKNAPAAIGPYSQGIQTGNILFTSGQLPANPVTGDIVEGGIKEQATQSLTNVKAVIEAAGGAMEHTVKTTCFLADMNDFAAFNEVYATFFQENPARSCVAVKTLPKNVLCEVEAIVEL